MSSKAKPKKSVKSSVPKKKAGSQSKKQNTARISPKISAAKKQKITKDMRIYDVTSKYPEAAYVMMSHGIHCVGCHAAMF